MNIRLDMAYALGESLGALQTFRELGITPPFQDAYNPYGVETEGADLLVYGHGNASTAWRWGFISQSERDMLKSFCPGKSAIVYVRLHNDDWEWSVCKAVMIWQPENPPMTGIIAEFVIQLRILENYGVASP